MYPCEALELRVVGERKTIVETTLSTPDRDSNLALTVIGSLVYCESSALDHVATEEVGHTIPNLDELGLAFQDLGINIQDLEEYIKNVESVPCVFDIPKYPIPRESHLNFLKPGSREVVTRPVHVHEHLPPMHPEMEALAVNGLLPGHVKLDKTVLVNCSLIQYQAPSRRKLFMQATSCVSPPFPRPQHMSSLSLPEATSYSSPFKSRSERVLSLLNPEDAACI
uniref:Uncharacterized protein n=1 Tax=Timema bartmani TaxID=61472 RepID=A0A7R9FAR0_9NEOP|nr:unnamed protein product [Timema bartmani]